jgi:hypothetical protein
MRQQTVPVNVLPDKSGVPIETMRWFPGASGFRLFARKS